MPSLTVPAPTLTYDQTPGGQAILEGAITVRCAAPSFPNGATVEPDLIGKSGYLIYRLAAPGALWEIWNDATRVWQRPSGSGDATLALQPLVFTEGDPFPWQGILIAAGQQDKHGQPRFAIVAPPSSHPQYALRAVFSATEAGEFFSGQSATTRPLTFVSMTDAMRAGLGLPAGQKPIDATQITVFLRSSNLSIIGSVDIRASGIGSEIIVANRTAGGSMLAALTLTADGEIQLQPAMGQQVVINGPLEAEQITYRPQGSAVKVTL